MKNVVSSFFFLLLPFCGYCQTYQGIVKNAQNEPLSFVNVVATGADNNEIITGAVTNEAGHFDLVVHTSKPFVLTASFIGFQNWEHQFETAANQDLGILILQESSSELDEIKIHTPRPLLTKKIDRLVFNVEESRVAAGGHALDVLQKTPGVRVEKDKVKVLGKSTVRILINNRLSLLMEEDLSNYLRSLPSGDIARIEVITNPPAEYEAEGNSGLINIVLKKNKTNFWGGELTGAYQQASFSSGSFGANIAYQKDKWSLFSSSNKGDGAMQVHEKNKIHYPTQVWDSDTKIKYFTPFLSNRTGVDYALNDQTSLGFQYLGNTSKPDNQEQATTHVFHSTQVIDSVLTTRAHADKKIVSHALNGHFKTVFDTLGKNLTLDLDYFTYTNKRNRINTSNTLIPQKEGADTFKNTANQEITTYTSTIHVEWPLSSVHFDFGGKISFMQNKSDIDAYNLFADAFVLDPNQSNLFNYTEDTQALYASASKAIKKWDFKLGLRLERTQTQGHSLTLNQRQNNAYTHFFPTVYITYTSNENNLWSFNYGKRINRPSYSSLNPFRWYSNPYSYTEGNPFLQPFFIDNVEFSHLYNNNLTTSFYVSKTTNGTDQITLTDSDTAIQATVRKNFLKEHSMGLAQSYTFNEVIWFITYLQYDLNYTKIESNIPNTKAKQSGFNFYFSMNNSFFLNQTKTVSGEITFQYAAPGINGMDYITESYAVDLGLKWLVLDNKFQLNLVASDLFKTNQNKIKSSVNTIKQEYQNYYDTRQIRISLVYRFGNNIASTKKKDFSNEEERKRID